MGLVVFPEGIPKDVVVRDSRDADGRRTQIITRRHPVDGLPMAVELFKPDGSNDANIYPRPIRIQVSASEYGMTPEQLQAWIVRHGMLPPKESR